MGPMSPVTRPEEGWVETRVTLRAANAAASAMVAFWVLFAVPDLTRPRAQPLGGGPLRRCGLLRRAPVAGGGGRHLRALPALARIPPDASVRDPPDPARGGARRDRHDRHRCRRSAPGSGSSRSLGTLVRPACPHGDARARR